MISSKASMAIDFTLLEQAIERFNGLLEGADVLLGHPPSSRDDWFRFEQLSEEPLGQRVIQRIAQQAQAEGQAAGTYTLRYVLYGPLALVGYLFATHNIVIRLHNNLLISDSEWLNHARWIDPSIRAARPGSPPADALFAELECLVGPLIDSWASQKRVARANAWACAIDSLAFGFQLAGKTTLNPDAVWAKWEAAVAGRVFPVRRRPRRFLFTIDEQRDELLIRSGCCLWCTQPAAQSSPTRYCASCYLQSDERRLEQLIALRRRKTSHA